jgi:hypothetical protein
MWQSCTVTVPATNKIFVTIFPLSGPVFEKMLSRPFNFFVFLGVAFLAFYKRRVNISTNQVSFSQLQIYCKD